MSDTIESVEELEQLVAEEEAPKPPSKAPMNFARAAWLGVSFALDLVTAWTVWQITSYWYYGVMWFFAGAVPLVMNQMLWERPENNETQSKLATAGIIVSVVTIVGMAIVAGVLYVQGTYKNLTVEAWVVGITVVLFAYHGLNAALFYFTDDDWKIKNEIAKAKAQANKKKQIIKAAGEVARAAQEAQNELHKQKGKYGEGVITAAMQKIEKKPAPANQQPPNLQPVNTFASDTKAVQTVDPTSPPSK